MTTQLKVNHICYTNVDDTQETLIPLLELALVKYLDGNDRGVFHKAACGQWAEQPDRCRTYISKLSFQYGFSVFLITLPKKSGKTERMGR